MPCMPAPVDMGGGNTRAYLLESRAAYAELEESRGSTDRRVDA